MCDQCSAEEPFILISGIGKVIAEPDIAILTIGVEERAKTSSDAMQANAAALQKVFDIAGQAGIAKSDITTSNLSLRRIEHRHKKTDEPIFSGYQVTNMVTVQVRELDKLGTVLDQMTRSGLNRIDDISFDTSRRDALLQEARRAAAEDIKSKLKLHRQSFGFEVKGVLEIQDSDTSGSDSALYGVAGGFSRQRSVPVSGGELEITVFITAKYHIG